MGDEFDKGDDKTFLDNILIIINSVKKVNILDILQPKNRIIVELNSLNSIGQDDCLYKVIQNVYK